MKANYWNQSSTCSEYTSVKHIWLNNKTRGYLAATDQGSLAILAMDFKEIDQEIEVINTHFGGVVDMVVSPCERILFTTGQDGTIFIFDIKEQLYNRVTKETRAPQIIEVDPQDTKKGTVKDTRLKIMDPDLADIVFVKKNQMDEWKHSQNILKYQLALTRKKIEIKLLDQKKKFDRQYQEIQKQKELDIKDLEKRHRDLTEQKKLQDRQNLQAMQKMESNHLQSVLETQQLYEKKLSAQESEYLNLEQQKLEMQQYYEKKI